MGPEAETRFFLGAWRAEAAADTRQDEEDSRDKGQDGAVGADVADVAENKTDEHEEETDQRERRGGADHLWKTSPPVSIKHSRRHAFLLTVASRTHHELASSSEAAAEGSQKCTRARLLTQHANGGLGGHLEVGRHHVFDVEASALLLR